VALLCATSGPSAAAATYIQSIEVHEGLCDASGAVALPGGDFGDRFLMVNNDDNFMRVYAVGDSGAPQPGPPLNIASNDITAATWLDGQAVFLAAVSPAQADGEDWQFLSLAVDGSDATQAAVKPAGNPDHLLAALAAIDGDLAKTIGQLGPAADQAALEAALEVEAMSVSADGAALFLGFRTPVPNGRALLVKLNNPRAVLFADGVPTLAPPIRLDLGGRGIRSMEYSRAADAYFIVAGPPETEGDFDLYRWAEGSDPMPIPGARAALASLEGFAPEGLIVDQSGRRLQLFGANDDCESETFRSVVLGLD